VEDRVRNGSRDAHKRNLADPLYSNWDYPFVSFFDKECIDFGDIGIHRDLDLLEWKSKLGDSLSFLIIVC
jgi:hypothetical protein